MPIKAKLPEKENIFTLCYDKVKAVWLSWTQVGEKFFTPKGGEFFDIFVPTGDSNRNNYFLHRYI